MSIDELLLVFAFMMIVTPTLVYLDATHHRIGKIKSHKSGFLKNWSASDWAIYCMVFGPVGWFGYLFRRRHLIETAKQYPVYVNIFQKIIVLLLYWLFWLLAGIYTVQEIAIYNVASKHAHDSTHPS